MDITLAAFRNKMKQHNISMVNHYALFHSDLKDLTQIQAYSTLNYLHAYVKQAN